MDRGVAPIVGFTVLIGLVGIASVGLLVVGTTMTENTQSAAEVQQAEQSVTQFADTANRVGHSEFSIGEFHVPETEEGAGATVDEDTGRIQVTMIDGGTEETLLDRDLGAVEYETGDGTVVAFQGGGVWRQYEDGTTMVRPPDFQYRQEPVPTLTFPHVRVRGNGTITGKGTLVGGDEVERFPGDGRSNPMAGDRLEVRIESEYCQGWHAHVVARTDATVSEGCRETGETSAPNELLVDMTVRSRTPEHDGFGVYSEGNVSIASNTGGNVNGTVAAGGDVDVPWDRYAHDGDVYEDLPAHMQPHDDEIADEVDGADPGDWERLCEGQNQWNCEYSGGQTVYVDDFQGGGGEVEFDVAAGNVTLVVDDDMRFNGPTNWSVLNYESGNGVEVYTTGDVVLQNDALELGPGYTPMEDFDPMDGHDSDAEALQLFAGSDAELSFTSASMELEMVISAPSAGTGNTSTLTVDVGGSLNYAGAIYVGDFEAVGSGSINLYQDARAIEPTGTGGSDDSLDVYYLHLSESELTVEE